MRLFSLPVLLIVAVLGAGFYAVQTKRVHVSVPSFIPTAKNMESKAGSSTAIGNLSSAQVAMQAYFTEYETYVGATMPAGTGTRIVRADASSFCLEYGVGTGVTHLAGPNGQAVPGPC